MSSGTTNYQVVIEPTRGIARVNWREIWEYRDLVRLLIRRDFSARYRPESNAQTFFVQAAIAHVAGIPLGRTGVEKDGVDGIYGPGTKAGLDKAIGVLGLKGTDLRVSASWKAFLDAVKAKGFAMAPDFNG